MVGARMTVGQMFRRTLMISGMLACQPALATAAQPGFSSPDDAVVALVGALRKQEPAALGELLGPGSEKLVHSGDPARDHQEGKRFLDAYNTHHALVGDGPDRLVLQVGPDDWPLPLPLVKQHGVWRFDARTGAQEIVDRRIGRNELAAIFLSLAYVDAQKSYFDLLKQTTGAGAYARLLISTPGKHDGLYWPPADGSADSPLTPIMTSALTDGYAGQLAAGSPVAYQGYYFRILDGQGTDAPSGEKSYMRGGKMTDGFALIAWPATYSASGIMTFVVNQDGVVFQKNLGPETAANVASMMVFNPGLDWTRIDVIPK